MKTRIAAVLFCIALVSVAVSPHGNEQHVMGKVTAISPNSITVHTTAKPPKDVTVIVVSGTMFMKSGAMATFQDLKVGDRVVIHAKPNADKKLEASNVDFGKPPAGSAQH